MKKAYGYSLSQIHHIYMKLLKNQGEKQATLTLNSTLANTQAKILTIR